MNIDLGPTPSPKSESTNSTHTEFGTHSGPDGAYNSLTDGNLIKADNHM